jgi:hypothetical protein
VTTVADRRIPCQVWCTYDTQSDDGPYARPSSGGLGVYTTPILTRDWGLGLDCQIGTMTRHTAAWVGMALGKWFSGIWARKGVGSDINRV